MVHTPNVTLFLWTIIVSAWYCCRVAVAHGDHSAHNYDHSTDEKSVDDPWHQHHHHHHHGHFHDHGPVDSRHVRNRNLLNSIFNGTLFSSSSRVDGNSGGGRCGTMDPSPEMMAESTRIVQQWMESPNSRQATTINVNTYFHIITATQGSETFGSITDTDVANQLQVLNDSFRSFGFSFTLLGTTRNDNSDWFYYDYVAMKAALRVGDASTLNVYFVDLVGLVGFATFPWFYELYPLDDGVVMNYGSIPGGILTPYDEGKTLVHEVGHWLGLFHTFQLRQNANSLNAYVLSLIIGDRANCWYNSDEVRDTPKQRDATRGCPTGRNSCVLNPGLDPIHNYMDYSDDACYTEFTNGQKNRMQAMWNEYRA
jgi:hypothetical protein